MTYSIVAWDRPTGMTGVGVATRHLAVGSLVPHARSGVGAVATQASTNPYFGPWGLDRLEQLQLQSGGELGAEAVLESLLQDDPGRDGRQVHLVDSQGRTAAWTGPDCAGLAAHRCYPGFSVAGNYLASELVLLAMAEAYMAAERHGLALEERLMAALEAAEAHGGDYRGRQSAALLVMHQESYPHIDFRVDHHPEPLLALREILAETSETYYTGFRATLPTTLGVAQTAELPSAAAAAAAVDTAQPPDMPISA
ncbi:DUF1028 domain-containing protein [Cyanobium sp. LEGE 06113]|uniref:DUF1028 domain-containing protein n=1 Tax=Cyanobium sp. LEGE 06113 TaxID=1297573 RepID=UPI001D144A84|nr:DUF1028 domain-containing protein [Cyanobium sp. LEGE 06113]